MSIVVNHDSISEKLSRWESSGKGSKTKDKKLREYIRHDVRTTEAGSSVLTMKMMRECADYLVRKVKEYASAAGGSDASLADSVRENINSLKRSPVVQSGTGFTCELNFGDGLSRPSLEPGRFPGGMPNIIALFNNGMDYSYFGVFGEWHGKFVQALPRRPGMHFMQDAVEDFNAKYGTLYGIEVQLLEVYER